MTLLVALLVGTPLGVGIGWLVWNAWNSNRVLDHKLEMGDVELLSSTNYKVSEVIRAPAGSRVEKIAPHNTQVNEGGYVRQKLPDGRTALIPIEMVQEIRSVHSTTHTIQQPPTE